MTTKDLVLYQLKTAGEFVSGEEISAKLGVSRAAVNGAVKSLRGDGYVIASVTNKGYHLQGGPERLSAGELLCCLGAERMGQVTVLESLDSTNTYLRNACAAGSARIGDCVVANCQTGGRGRQGRSFTSEKNLGLYMSCVLDPKNVAAEEISQITAWGAVAVQEAIEEVCGVSCQIKWVNDLVWHTLKVCGILTEVVLEGESGRTQSIIMGIGVNVNYEEKDFPLELDGIATSLKLACGHTVSRAKLCGAILQRLDKLCQDFPHNKAQYLVKYRESCAILGKRVGICRGEETRWGTAQAIDPSFGLVVAYDNGQIETVAGGEISVEGFYGTSLAQGQA